MDTCSIDRIPNKNQDVKIIEDPFISKKVIIPKRNAVKQQGKVTKEEDKHGKDEVLKEGELLKHSDTPLKKGTYRMFKLYPGFLHYSRLKDEVLRNTVDIRGAIIAERGSKNTSHTFTIISNSGTLVISAENRRDMEEWMSCLKTSAGTQEEKSADKLVFTSNHNWYQTTSNKLTFCNACREPISNKGLCCNLCNMLVHKNCTNMTKQSCKWLTRESIKKDGIRLLCTLAQPHQWLEGNLPSNQKCTICRKPCGSKKSLQDFICIWCSECIHEGCKVKVKDHCNLGKNKGAILPASVVSQDSQSGSWRILDTSFSVCPLIAFVNSRAGDNQGVKFVRRLRNMLNSLQVVDLGVSTPEEGLIKFSIFERFRILICGGDGTAGWVLLTLDKLNLHNKARSCIVPLGTGNDLARVLGWGASCDDDAKLIQILDDIGTAQIHRLDRWSVSQSIFRREMPKTRARILAVEGHSEHTNAKNFSQSNVNEYVSNTTFRIRRRSSAAEQFDMLNLKQFADQAKLTKALSNPNLDQIDDFMYSPVKTKANTVYERKDLNPIKSSIDSMDIEFNFTPLSDDQQQDHWNVDQKLANLVEIFSLDIKKQYPQYERVDITISEQMCTQMQFFVNNLLNVLKERLLPEDYAARESVSILLSMQDELAAIDNSIRLLNNKSKNFIPENNIVIKFSAVAYTASLIDELAFTSQCQFEYVELLFIMYLKALKSTEDATSMNEIKIKLNWFSELNEHKIKLPSQQKLSVKSESNSNIVKNITTMNNYLGIGLDAKISLDFHNMREHHPEKCKTRSQNKMWYSIFSGRQLVSGEFKHFSEKLELECDGEEIELPHLQGIVLLNIPSYMAGTNFWGTEKKSGQFSAPSFDDKKLEVIAVMGTGHMAESKMLGIQRYRLAQAESIKITIKGIKQVPLQVDGEAWMQNPGVLLIQHKNKANMLVKNKKIMLSHFDDPILIRRVSSQDSVSTKRQLATGIGFAIKDLIAALNEMLTPIKRMIQNKTEYDEYIDVDLVVAHQEADYFLLSMYERNGDIIEQGLVSKYDGLVEICKSIIKETYFHLAMSDPDGKSRDALKEKVEILAEKMKCAYKKVRVTA